MANYIRPEDRGESQIAVVCALPVEYDAVALAFDQFWDGEIYSYGQADRDANTYKTGRIGHHIVVLVLPSWSGDGQRREYSGRPSIKLYESEIGHHGWHSSCKDLDCESLYHVSKTKGGA
jgi:hypothetical protein